MKNESLFDVAIVGGGFSGTLVAVHLLRAARPGTRLALIERAPRIGRGVAYGTSDPWHLLNVPARGMSAFPDDPGHFVRWLREREPAADIESAFVPRRTFSLYLATLLEDAEAARAAGVEFVRIHEDEVLAARITETGVVLACRSGAELPARRVVLAVGNLPPGNPTLDDPAFCDSPRFVADPWSADALANLDADAPILLIGTGLTMVDTVVSLRMTGHRGPVHALSRHGLLPHEHDLSVGPRPLSDFDGGPSARALTRNARAVIRRATAEGHDWRAAVDGFRPHVQRLWQGLSVVEKDRFMRHVRPYWEVHRHRVAPEVKRHVDAMLAEGQLTVRAARILRFSETPNGVEVRLKPRGDAATYAIEVERVINCTGPKFNLARHPLLADLVRQGLTRSDPLALGVDVDAEGRCLDRDGNVSDLFSAIGPLRKGMLWESTAVPEIRVQARDLVARLTE